MEPDLYGLENMLFGTGSNGLMFCLARSPDLEFTQIQGEEPGENLEVQIARNMFKKSIILTSVRTQTGRRTDLVWIKRSSIEKSYSPPCCVAV